MAKSTDVEYQPDATHWAVTDLTAHLGEELEGYMWAVLGRALWSDPERTFTLVVGPARGGKSTLIRAVHEALGRYAGTVSEDLFRSTRHGGKTGPTPEREPLVQKRVVTAIECESWDFEPSRLKAFSGGMDRITVQPKYLAEYDAPITATILIAANDFPRLDLGDPALADRLRILSYPKPLKENPKIAEAVKNDPAFAVAMLARL